jgi:nicotinamidase-related amidase
VIEVNGKTVLTELHEIAAPGHTALVVVDMQNDLVNEDGAFARQGADVSAYGQMVPRLRGLIDAAREAGVLVVFVRATTLPNDLSRSPAQILFELRMKESYAHPLADRFEWCLAGTRGHAVVDALGARPDDLTVDKHRSSAFVGTNLDVVLRSNAIRTVVVTGCTTEGCVDSTVRDAGFLDYYPVVPRDCVASDNPKLHDAAMLILEAYRAVVTDSPALARAWRGAA